MNELPKFFNYDEEGRTDNGYETIQDFFLSWTLRCSISRCQMDNYLIHYYSKRIVYSLIYGVNSEKKMDVDFSDLDVFEVIEVKTKRQFNRIDLLAEIQVKVNTQIEVYLISIENKWYTKIGQNQLGNSVKSLEANYDLLNKKLVNVVVFCDNTFIKNDDSQIKLCRDNKYKFCTIQELKNIVGMDKFGKTGNYLFDEYWIHSFR